MDTTDAFNNIPTTNAESAEEKVEQLNQEIQTLFELSLKHGMNGTIRGDELQTIKRAQAIIEEYRDLLKEGIDQKVINHPAYKPELDDKEILARYKRLKSFRAVARVLNCDPKTIKTRLEKMGYLKKSI